MANGVINATNDTFNANVGELVAGIAYVGLGGAAPDAINLVNTLIADAPAADLTIYSPDGTSANIAGFNDLFTSVPSFYGSFPDSIVTSTPGLGAFGNHGGPTPTVPLLPGSPAIGQADANALPSPDDQRGFPRHPGPDIGAEEMQPPSIEVVSGSNQRPNLNTSFASPLEVKVLDDETPVPDVIVTFSAPEPVNILTDAPVAAASFPAGMFAELTTNAQGIATAPALLADGVAGSYNLTASAQLNGVNLGPVTFTETNTTPPKVVSGGPYTIDFGQSLTLNATGSSDPYGHALSYSWTINGHANAASGVTATLSWSQLEALGVNSPETFPIAVRVSDQVVQPYTVTTTLTIDDTPPTATISGLPAVSTPEATSLDLTAMAIDASQVDSEAGFNYLWEVGFDGGGDEDITGESLQFNGDNPTSLPSGLITGNAFLNVAITFQTTSGGVILGYQNQPSGTTPTAYVPALYVGTNGLLYAEIYNGSSQQLVSTKPVNDGAEHTVILSEADNSLEMFLDGALVGQLFGAPVPLGMTYDQLGTGYGNSSVYSATPAVAYDPFKGTIDSVQIEAYQANVDLPTVPYPLAMAAPTKLTFTPPDAGTDTITVLATDQFGRTGVKTASLTVADIPIVVSPGANAVVVQGGQFMQPGTFTDAPADRPWTATVNYGDGTGTQPLPIGGNQSFMLSHLYEDAGSFTVTVTVANQDGVTGTGTVPRERLRVHGERRQPAAVDDQKPDLHVPLAHRNRAWRLRAPAQRAPQQHPYGHHTPTGWDDLRHRLQGAAGHRRLAPRRALHADHLAQEGEGSFRGADDSERREHVRAPLWRRGGDGHGERGRRGPAPAGRARPRVALFARLRIRW